MLKGISEYQSKRGILEKARSHQGMKVLEEIIKRHCKAKGRHWIKRSHIGGASHIIHAQEEPRGRIHQKRS